MKNILNIIKDSNYSFSLFDQKLVDELESDFNDWKEARHYAKAAGAAPEGFSSIENQAQVGRIVESLGMSKIRAANISKELSRVSVFM